MKKKTLKSIGAVLAGFLTVFILSSATDAILEAAGIFPPISQGAIYNDGLLAFALFYRSIYAILGGIITATLAPSKPMKHVKILAVLGLIGGVLGVIGGWNLSSHWYPIALAVTAYPLVWLGGKLKLAKFSKEMEKKLEYV